MRRNYFITFLLTCSFVPLLAQNSVVTSPPLAGGNGAQGVTFNAGSNQTVQIDSFSIALYGTATQTLNVWYNTTAINGAPTISTGTGWVLYETITINNITGNFTPPLSFYTIPLTTPLLVPAGQTFGFYIGNSTGTSVAYTTHTTSNQDVFTDGTMTVWTGPNVGYGGTSPSPGNHPRQFNGTVYYSSPVFTPWDAGVTFIDPPSVCSGSHTFSAGIRNYGDSVINSLVVNWTVNGTPQTPITYSGTLDTAGGTGSTVDTVILGSVLIPSGGTTVISAWTTNLNGTNADTVNFNDTVTVGIAPSLAGNYTIGGIGADYPSFGSAVSDLNARGVCSAVTFDVANGLYQEQVTLNDIVGASATNTITFRSVSGDSSLVTLRSAGTTTTDNHTVFFDGADYVTFEGMTLENTSTTYSTVVRFNGSSDHNRIQNCRIICPPALTTSTNNVLIYSPSGSNDNDAWFLNNVMSGGSYSMYWYGAGTTTRAMGVRVEGNQIKPGYYRGLYFYSIDDVEVRNNSLYDTLGLYPSGFYWIYMGYCLGGPQVTGNYIGGATNSTTTGYGLYLSSSGGSVNDKSVVANNFFSYGTPGSTNPFYGIYVVSSGHIDILHNNMMVTSSSATARAMFLSSGGNVRLTNNNIMIDGPGTGVYLSNTFVVSESDYNNFYAPMGNVGYANGATQTLAQWQSASGFDMNGQSVNPNYPSYLDLHVCNDTLDGTGLNVGVLTDFDGDGRNPLRIDIGADQFIAGKPELGDDTFFCTGSNIVLGSPPVSNVGYLWNTGATTSTLTVNIPGTYFLTATTACGTGTDTIVITQADGPLVDYNMLVTYMTGSFTNNTQNANSYLWDFGDGDTSTAVNPIHVYTTSGSHLVTLYATNECGTDSITKQIIVISPGISENNLEGNISVYPNPSNGLYRLNMSALSGTDYQMQVSTLQGQVVASRKLNVSQGVLDANLDLSTLPSGVYLLKVSGESGSAAVRLVKN